MKVAVVALGKIGLPLAVQIASKGWRVYGADVAPGVVDQVNQGIAPFPGEDGLDSKLKEVVAREFFTATTDTREAVSESDVVVVVVPLMTGADGTVDFAAIDSATDAIGGALRPGTLVSYETTLPVGTTRGRFGPALEAATGWRAGEGFHLVHSPERVFSGRVFRDLRRYPKLVGGVDDASTEKGVEFYEKVLDFDERPDLPRGNGVWAMGSSEAAELAKLAETTYRDVNIALANEFARFSEANRVDVWEVIDAANSQPFSHIHRPGVAVGGHCIPVYPRFYLLGDPTASVVAESRKVNDDAPRRVVDRLATQLGGLEGRTVLILGAAYRGGVKEVAYSGVYGLRDRIGELGGSTAVSDPLYSEDELTELGLEPWLGAPVDAIVVQADHEEYRELNPGRFGEVKLLYDGRGVVDVQRWRESGAKVLVVGQGATAD